jgi:hypothetical protein
MKSLNTKSLLAMSAVAALMFCSCSKQIASIGQSDKMISSDVLVASKMQTKNMPPVKNELNTLQACVDYPTCTPVINTGKTGIKTAKTGKSKVAKAFAATKKVFSDIIVKEFKTQTAAIGNFASKKHIASISGNKKAEGLGGLAAICAIAAIAMAVLGITHMGTIFWELSVVLIIAAIVFFVVYLVGKAASPSPGGE